MGIALNNNITLSTALCNVPFGFYSKKHKHFGVSHVSVRRKSVVNSAKVTMLEFLSLDHQQCYIFVKIKGNIIKGTEAIILYVALHCLFGDWFPHSRRLLHFCEGQMAVSLRKWMVFGPAQSGKFSLYQRHLKKTKCWRVTSGCWSV